MERWGLVVLFRGYINIVLYVSARFSMEWEITHVFEMLGNVSSVSPTVCSIVY